MMEVCKALDRTCMLLVLTSSATGVVDPCICDEVAIQVWFDPVSYTVDENAGTVTLTIRTNIAGGPPAGSVLFNTENGTALGIVLT